MPIFMKLVSWLKQKLKKSVCLLRSLIRALVMMELEYVCNAHQADAMICISNCDKITPGMMMAAMRINIPAIFVSGGPMEAGKVRLPSQASQELHVDLI